MYHEVESLESRCEGTSAFKRALEAIKDAVRIEAYLRDHGVELRQNRSRCPVHDGDNPYSFSVDAEKQLWHCFSCGAGGDLINLCERLESHTEPWTAMVSLSQRYGVAIPGRSEAWHERQEEKADERDGLRKVYARSYRRRLFRAFFSGYLEGVEPELREEEGRQIWDELWPTAWVMAGRRMEK